MDGMGQVGCDCAPMAYRLSPQASICTCLRELEPRARSSQRQPQWDRPSESLSVYLWGRYGVRSTEYYNPYVSPYNPPLWSIFVPETGTFRCIIEILQPRTTYLGTYFT